MATTRTRTTTKSPTEQIDVKRCQCGCGVAVKKQFAQGHDSVLKSRLLTEFDGGSEEAGEELVQRGWRTAEELVRRQTAREDAAKAKTDAAAQREAKKVEPKPKRTTRKKTTSNSQAV